jgi:hypothetical protein
MSTRGGGIPSAAGIAVRDLRWALGEIAGEPALERALVRLPEEVRRPFLDAPAEPWVPLTVTSAVVDSVAAEIDECPEALVDRAIVMATERTLTTVLRVLLRFTTNKALLARIPGLYRRTRNVGELRVVSVDGGAAELVIEGWPDVPARHARLVAVNTETILKLIGRKDPRVHFARTGARYRILWRP